jgi:hypothetical protein
MFLLGLNYAMVVGWLAFQLAGGGHGSGFFLAVCIPGLLLWPAAGLALAFAHRPIGRWLAPAILIIEYLLSLDIMALTDARDRADVAMMCARAPWMVFAYSTTFLAGQAALWLGYALKRRTVRGTRSRRRITLAGAMMAILVVSLLLAIVAVPARWVFLKS